MAPLQLSPEESQITPLLQAWSDGDRAALDRLTPLVYDQLRRLARHYMNRERWDNTLQPTALANEAFLRLANGQAVRWKDRVHFFAVSATVMRRILISAARARYTVKRGGHLERIDSAAPLDLRRPAEFRSQRSAVFIALDEALNVLAEIDQRKARVIELRFFGGLTVEETAQVLQISPQSVMRDWKLARAWLSRELRSKTAG